MDSMWISGFLLALAVVLAIVVMAWHFSKSASMLQKWAEENGYQIHHSEHRYLRRGPFFWSTSRNQVVLYIEATDSQGRQRRGYVRLGSWWWGLLQEKVEVQWEEDNLPGMG